MRDELSVLIVDDEKEARILLGSILKKIPAVKAIGEAKDVAEALEIIEEKPPDVVLLDIEMPGQNGFELLSKMRASGLITDIIFMTAYNQYAIKAIRHAAFG